MQRKCCCLSNAGHQPTLTLKNLCLRKAKAVSQLSHQQFKAATASSEPLGL
jgi:hypothetical protein